MNDTDSSRRRLASLLMMVASGFAGLGYQMVWTQQGAVWLGHESAAVLAVVAAFFGGLATGAWTLGARIQRSRRPVRWYAGCELVIALWGLLLVFAMAPASAWMLRLTGVQPSPLWQWSVAFLGSFGLLLPATAAMGATLPAMERLAAHARVQGRSIAVLYASNTLGAVIGVLATAFWLAPELGLRGTALVCIGLNLLCALTALAVFPASVEQAPETRPGEGGRAAGVVGRLALTGLLGIGYEVVVVRVLGQVTENTVYTFALLLAVYLVGSSLGAAGYQRWLARRPAEPLGDMLLAALAGACLAGSASLWGAEALRAGAQRAFGAGLTAAVSVEAVLALAAFGAPTIAMGALFSHLCQQAVRSGVSFGRALGVNTLGAAAAPAVFGVLAHPLLGARFALLLIAAGYLALTSRRGWLRPGTWLPAAGALALALLAPPLAFIAVPPGGRVVRHQDGLMASVSVVEDGDGVARLHINNRQQEGSSATLRVDGRQAWLPLLLHPAPRQALFLGLGTGTTAAAAAEDPALEVDAVELLPEVIAASSHFTARFREGAANPRLHLLSADARRYVRASDRRYDVIVSDNFHPARSGSGSLYTVEHFQAVRQRLRPGGLFCQWLPLHQLDLDSLRSIVQSFLIVSPRAWAMLASNSLETPVLGLVARADGGRFDAAVLRDRRARLTVPARLSGLGLEDEFAPVGEFIAGPAALRRFAGDAPANTDDHPVVAHRAPHITYAPDSRPRDRLIALLRQLEIQPADLLDDSPDQGWRARLQAYWSARDRFVELGRDVRPSADVRQMLAQVQEPLLSVLRISPDFRPAYDPLLAMAMALARNDLAGARALLTALSELQPERSEARRALELVAGEGDKRTRN